MRKTPGEEYAAVRCCSVDAVTAAGVAVLFLALLLLALLQYTNLFEGRCESSRREEED